MPQFHFGQLRSTPLAPAQQFYKFIFIALGKELAQANFNQAFSELFFMVFGADYSAFQFSHIPCAEKITEDFTPAD